MAELTSNSPEKILPDTHTQVHGNGSTVGPEKVTQRWGLRKWDSRATMRIFQAQMSKMSQRNKVGISGTSNGSTVGPEVVTQLWRLGKWDSHATISFFFQTVMSTVMS